MILAWRPGSLQAALTTWVQAGKDLSHIATGTVNRVGFLANIHVCLQFVHGKMDYCYKLFVCLDRTWGVSWGSKLGGAGKKSEETRTSQVGVDEGSL